MFCLTDMWKLAGSDPDKRPGEWLRLPQTVVFLEYLEGVGNTHCVVTHEPRNPRDGEGASTWAHWQLVLDYATYLSPGFQAWYNATVIRRSPSSGSRNASRRRRSV